MDSTHHIPITGYLRGKTEKQKMRSEAADKFFNRAYYNENQEECWEFYNKYIKSITNKGLNNVHFSLSEMQQLVRKTKINFSIIT